MCVCVYKYFFLFLTLTCIKNEDFSMIQSQRKHLHVPPAPQVLVSLLSLVSHSGLFTFPGITCCSQQLACSSAAVSRSLRPCGRADWSRAEGRVRHWEGPIAALY